MQLAKRDLVAAARAAQRHSYAPYSDYPVGAAILARSGKIYSGCNIENAVYGATVCAERVATFTAIAAGERDFVALAVAASGKRLITPCGICRQVLFEFAPDLIFYLTGSQGTVETIALKELLPRAFGPAHLLEEDA